MPVERITLVGQKELIAALRKVDRSYVSRVNRAMRDAADAVTSRSRQEYARSYRQGTSGRRSRTVKGITSIAGGRKAGVKLDGTKRPWLPGQEFGSDTMKRFAPWTGKGPGGAGSRGRFLFPVIRDEIDEVMDQLADDLDAIFRDAMTAMGGL